MWRSTTSASHSFDLHRRTLQAEYSELARRYDGRWARYVATTNDWAAEALESDLGAAKRIVDVGCGTGALLSRLARRSPHARLLGVDFSPAMLAVARRELGDGVALVVGRAGALPLAAGSVDVLASVNMLHFDPAPATALAHWHALLAPGGQLVLVDWCADHWPTRLLDGWLRWRGRQPGRALTLAACGALLERAGFRDVRAERRRLGVTWGLMRFTARKGTG